MIGQFRIWKRVSFGRPNKLCVHRILLDHRQISVRCGTLASGDDHCLCKEDMHQMPQGRRGKNAASRSYDDVLVFHLHPGKFWALGSASRAPFHATGLEGLKRAIKQAFRVIPRRYNLLPNVEPFCID